MNSRILFVLTRFAMGGAELHTIALAKGLTHIGASCSVVAIRKSSKWNLSGMSPKIRSIRSFSVLAALVHFFRKERPAIAIATLTKAAFP